jgi:hypothetical protein
VEVQHLEVGWEAQGLLLHPVLGGETSKARITIRNRGTENETNVSIILYRNGTIWDNWTQTLAFGSVIVRDASQLLSAGSYNLTVQTTIPSDANLANNRQESVLRVIAPPHLNFTYTPQPPVVNQTTAFDASPSYHGESGANITSYNWQFWAPGASSPSYSTSNITVAYQFASSGLWRVILSVTDSFGMNFRQYRSASQAYRLETAIRVQETVASGGFPIEYLLAVVIIVVVVAALAVVMIRRRRGKKT